MTTVANDSHHRHQAERHEKCQAGNGQHRGERVSQGSPEQRLAKQILESEPEAWGLAVLLTWLSPGRPHVSFGCRWAASSSGPRSNRCTVTARTGRVDSEKLVQPYRGLVAIAPTRGAQDGLAAALRRSR